MEAIAGFFLAATAATAWLAGWLVVLVVSEEVKSMSTLTRLAGAATRRESVGLRDEHPLSTHAAPSRASLRVSEARWSSWSKVKKLKDETRLLTFALSSRLHAHRAL